MRKTIIAVALCAAIIPVLAATSPVHGPRLDRMAERLALTEEQKGQVELILTEQQQKRQALRDETRARMDEVLTEEQRAKLDEMRNSRSHRDCWRGGPGPRW
jgi:Spy/CpxP family protein refolding chaperone